MKYIKSYEVHAKYWKEPYNIGEYLIMDRNYEQTKKGYSEYPYVWPYVGLIFQFAKVENNRLYFKNLNGQSNTWRDPDFLKYCRRLTPDEYEKNKNLIEDFEIKEATAKYNL